jgi:hypothetical protein
MNRTLLIMAALLGACCTTQAQTNIPPDAERILRNACNYLAEAPFFSIKGETWRDFVNESGQKFQYTRSAELEVKRPNRFHAELHSSHSARGFWYDGKSLTILDRQRNLFSDAPMPGTIDAALDSAHDQLGVDLPLIDLAVNDPYKNATADVQSAIYFGTAPVLGIQCHHLAFTQDNIDWQIWIQDGPQPLIRKFVITHKNEPGAPQFTALITDWDMVDRIANSDFVFEAPPEAVKIQMRKEGDNQLAPTGRAGTVTSPREK